MLVTFKSKAYEDITMFGDIAIKLIKMLGHSGTIPGAILADEVPLALSKLKEAVSKNKPLHNQVSTEEDDDDSDVVNLSQRAFPLIEMLTHAAKAHSNVMWDKS